MQRYGLTVRWPFGVMTKRDVLHSLFYFVNSAGHLFPGRNVPRLLRALTDPKRRTRSFDEKDMSDNEEFFSKIMKSSYQLRSNYEKTFKNPDEHHFVCKLIKYSNGNYTLRMQEKGKDMEYYDGILK